MTGRLGTIKRHEAIDWYRENIGKPALIHIHTRILVHDRRRRPGKCPCCNSTRAEIVETIEDLDLLVSRKTGDRKLKSEAKNKKEWKRLAATAERIDIPLRCHRDQLSSLLNVTSKVVCVLGGNRSGKTSCGVYWMVRQWIIRGGKNAAFWMVSPQRDQTRILINKLLLGESGETYSPPALPLTKEGNIFLAKSWPKTALTPDQDIHMIDGSIITMKHAARSGGNLKGHAVKAILGDEVCEIKKKENWTIMMMRTADAKGQIFVSTTPIAGHWLKDMVVDQAKSDINPEGNDDFWVCQLSSLENPWMDKDEILRLIDDLDDPLIVRREVHGEWVGNKGNLWIHFDPAAHTFDGPGFDAKDFEFFSVTQQAYRAYWRGRNDFVRSLKLDSPLYVGGQDFNTWPMTTIIAQVVVRNRIDRNDPSKWVLLILDEVQTRQTNSWRHSEWLNSKQIRGGRVDYSGLAIACDSTGAYSNVGKTPSHKDSASDAKVMAQMGHDCRPCDYGDTGKPRNPRRRDGNSLVHKLFRQNRIMIHSRCAETIRSFSEQEDDGTGVAVKKPSTASDRLSSPSDAAKYLAWKVFSVEERPVARFDG